MITSDGYRCHECEDTTRIGRNCSRPLRSDDLPDLRNPSQPTRCPVEGGESSACVPPVCDRAFADRIWSALDTADAWDRCHPSEIPADVDAWYRTVRAMYQQAQSWQTEHKRKKADLINASMMNG